MDVRRHGNNDEASSAEFCQSGEYLQASTDSF
jgi:hypothetical protein